MNRDAETLLNQAAAESQARLRRWKTIGKRVGILLLVPFFVGGIVAALSLYQTTSSRQFAYLMVTIGVFAFAIGGCSWAQQRFYPQNKSASTVFLVIKLLLYVALFTSVIGVWRYAAP